MTPYALIPILMDEYYLSVIQVSLLTSIPRIVQLTLSIPSGLLADKFRAGKLIFLSLFLSAIAGLIIFIDHSIWGLIIGFTLIAASSTFYHPPALSAVSKILPENFRSRGLGLHGSSGLLGISLGPITIGLLLNLLGWRFAYLIWIPPIIFGALLSLLIKVDFERKREKRFKFTTPLRKVFSLTFILFLLFISARSAAGSSISTFATTYLTKGRGVEFGLASIVYGLSPLIGLIGPIIGGWLGDKFGWRKSFIMVIIGMIIFLIGVAISPLIILTFTFYLLFIITSNMTTPLSTTLISLIVGEEARGTAYSMYFLPMSLSGIFMPIIASIFIDNYGLWTIFPLSIILYLTSIVLLYLIRI